MSLLSLLRSRLGVRPCGWLATGAIAAQGPDSAGPLCPDQQLQRKHDQFLSKTMCKWPQILSTCKRVSMAFKIPCCVLQSPCAAARQLLLSDHVSNPRLIGRKPLPAICTQQTRLRGGSLLKLRAKSLDASSAFINGSWVPDAGLGCLNPNPKP